VAETLEPGSSVSIVARRHDVNANQVFKWRREDVGGTAAGGNGPEPAVDSRPRARRSGVIEITFGCGTRVCLRGEVVPETLRQVIALLR
jgi:transposase